MIHIGILAHVDAGKTTLTERILFETGATRSVGRVDDGSAHTDTLEVERRRGISVRAASAQIEHRGEQIYLIDTPGHMDFSAEIEFSLLPLECAVLVVSAVEGVQSQTRAVYQAAKKRNIPILFFINKTDRAGADAAGVLEEIRAEFGVKPADFCSREDLIDAVCDRDDEFLAYCLEHEPDRDEILARLAALFRAGLATVYVAGSALQSRGVDALLDAIVALCPRFADPGGETAAVAFRVEHSRALGRLVHVKLLSGALQNRGTLYNPASQATEKILQIRKIKGLKFYDAGALSAGEIGVLSGFSRTKAGDLLLATEGAQAPAFVKSLDVAGSIAVPLLRARVTPADERDYPALVAAVEELSAEDPNLRMLWEKETRELILHVTGRVQLEILEELMRRRFDLRVSFGDPSVIYKETPTMAAEGYEAYTMPKPCWAVLRFLIEPAARGSGVSYKSTVNANKLFYAYQAQVAQALPGALSQGPLGWEVTDVNITLIDGEHHLVHTHPLDFIVATPMAVMNGLAAAKTTLLEPLYAFRLDAPEEYGGRLMQEIIGLRGRVDAPAVSRGRCRLEGVYPVSAGLDFPVRAASLSRGQARLSLAFGGYQPCDLSLGRTVPYRGVSPLDRAKYILHVRHAL